MQQRTRVLIKFQTLLVENKDDIANCMVSENGKTKVDALGDITRGIEVVEHCLAMPSLMMGEAVEQISSNMDTKTIRQPLGVVAGIAPFNFPAMIPLWMLPIAVGTGNAFILKPSEKVSHLPLRAVPHVYCLLSLHLLACLALLLCLARSKDHQANLNCVAPHFPRWGCAGSNGVAQDNQARHPRWHAAWCHQHSPWSEPETRNPKPSKQTSIPHAIPNPKH